MRPIVKKGFEQLYCQYNRRAFVHPDPLEFLYHYENLSDREIVAFVASSLAYGRVAHILKSVSSVLERMVPTPSIFLEHTSLKALQRTFSGFKHRFTNGHKLSSMLFGIRKILEEHGSLNACFSTGLKDDDDTILPALSVFSTELATLANHQLDHLVPLPAKGSACKRLNLFLRWMVRSDEVDPGGWENVSPAKLIVPIDTHMHRICRLLGITARKQADMRAAVEITEAFRTISPEDPVRYDFCITRLGIREDGNLDAFLEQFKGSSYGRFEENDERLGYQKDFSDSGIDG